MPIGVSGALLLWGVFEDEIHVEFEGEKFGPYYPVSCPIPLHRYRAFKRGKTVARTKRIRTLAEQLAKLSPPDQAAIDQILAETLTRSVVLSRVRRYFREQQAGEGYAG